jgi:hypothetical protein
MNDFIASAPVNTRTSDRPSCMSGRLAPTLQLLQSPHFYESRATILSIMNRDGMTEEAGEFIVGE